MFDYEHDPKEDALNTQDMLNDPNVRRRLAEDRLMGLIGRASNPKPLDEWRRIHSLGGEEATEDARLICRLLWGQDDDNDAEDIAQEAVAGKWAGKAGHMNPLNNLKAMIWRQGQQVVFSSPTGKRDAAMRAEQLSDAHLDTLVAYSEELAAIDGGDLIGEVKKRVKAIAPEASEYLACILIGKRGQELLDASCLGKKALGEQYKNVLTTVLFQLGEEKRRSLPELDWAWMRAKKASKTFAWLPEQHNLLSGKVWKNAGNLAFRSIATRFFALPALFSGSLESPEPAMSWQSPYKSNTSSAEWLKGRIEWAKTTEQPVAPKEADKPEAMESVANVVDWETTVAIQQSLVPDMWPMYGDKREAVTSTYVDRCREGYEEQEDLTERPIVRSRPNLLAIQANIFSRLQTA